MKHILVTGANGQLGRDLVRVLSGSHSMVGCSHQDMDVTRADETRELTLEVAPDVIIHAAAFTDVDKAESEVDAAFRVNALGARNVAVAASLVGARMVHISTDYVFDGMSGRPYTEFDAPRPINVYGQSKLAGEQLVRVLCPNHIVVRTSWLYGEHGDNFVRTMLRLAADGGPVRAVSDRFGTPTWTCELARQIGRLIEGDVRGTYHCSAGGGCSRFEFAVEIMNAFSVECAVLPATSDEFRDRAVRPVNSVLRNYVLELEGRDEMLEWQTALHAFAAQEMRKEV